MPKKLTKSEILRRLDQRNLTHDPVYIHPVSQPYIHQKSPLQFRCRYNHIWMSNSDRTITGVNVSGCPQCKLNTDRLNKRIPWVDILSRCNTVHNNKYSYFEQTYVNSVTSINVECPTHGIFKITPNSHMIHKRGCKKCVSETVLSKRLEMFITKSTTKHNGYYDYNDVVAEHISKLPIIITCPTHGNFTQRSGDHLNGHGCKKCNGQGVSLKQISWLTYVATINDVYIMHAGNVGEYIIPNTKYPVDGYCASTNTVYEFYGDVFHGNPSLYTTDEHCHPYDDKITAGDLYNKTMIKENIITDKGYNLITVWEHDFNKLNIPTIDKTKMPVTCFDSRTYVHDTPTDWLNTIKLDLIDGDFKGYKYKHRFRCKKCGSPFTTTLTQRIQSYKQRGTTGCPSCVRQGNVNKILTKLLDNVEHTIEDHVILIGGSKIGIYVQRLRSNFRTQCVDLQRDWIRKGIELKIVFVDEILDNPNLVISKIKHYAQLNNLPRIHGRACTIREIHSTQKNEFLRKFHIQRNDRATIKLGAFYLGNLVAVMTFCEPRIIMSGIKTTGKWELSRFATDTTVVIPGIASKLLTYFERTYAWTSIYSYADVRWSLGQVYGKLGFERTHQNPPSYWYIIDGIRKHRWGYRKDAIRDKFPDVYSQSKTEYQMMTELGYHRLWDAGTILYNKYNIIK